MAKKKPKGNTGPGGKGSTIAGNASKRENDKNETISEFVLVTTDANGRNKRQTWDAVRKYLKSWQDKQKKEKHIERDHINHYRFDEIEADFNEKEQVYRDALAVDRRGKEVATKAAKNAKDQAGQTLKKVKEDRKSKRFATARRQEAHEAITNAQQTLEDWLYYQDLSKRRRRLQLLDPDQRILAQSKRRGRKYSYMIGDDHGYYDWVRSLLELYDSRNIGGQDYKQGRHDHLGNRVKKRGNEAALPVVGPDELHMWTPNYRRRLVGLRAPEEDDDSDTSQDIEPTHFWLDEAGIEGKRAAVEKKSDTKTQNLEFDTHEARRRDEVKRYGNSRPDTSADRMTNTPNGVVAENRWGEIRTEQGLFISARESSWDWRTSYDCLGPVMSGWFPETSAIRDEAPEEWIDPDDKPRNVDGDDSERSAPRVPEEQAGELLRGASDKRAKKRGTAQEPPGEATRGKQPANDKSGPAKPVNESQKKVKVEIDYRYPASEFCKVKRPFRPVERRWFTTEWAEETTGRRERHTYHMEPHSSPVHSPPRSPIMEEMTAIPVGFPESDARAVPLERRSQRKCLLNLNRCRAFWTHSLNECWIPYSERPKRPKDPIEWPIQEIDPPKGEDEDGSNGYVPTIGIPVYRSRLYDHYGLIYPNTSPSEDWKRQQWPRIGIRVPYEPMTIEDLRVRGADEDAMAIDPTTRPAREIEHGGGARDNDMGTEGYNELSDTPDPSDSASNKRRKLGTILAPDADKRALYEVRSMAVPVIATPQRPWAPLKDDRADEYHGDGYDSDDNGSETDDDGDLFFKSYEAGCFPNDRPAPIAPPVTSAENHEPGTAPEDVQPASAAPEVVMTEESDDADL